MTKKVVIGIVIFAILATGMVAALFLIRQQQELRKKAAPATTVSILPQTTTTRVGEELTLTVEMNTSTNTVVAADVQITFDATKLTLKAFTPSTFLPVVVAAPQVNNTTGSATVTLSTQPANPPQGTGTLATLKFEAKAAGTVNVSLGPATRATGIQEGTDIVVARNGSSVTILAAAGATLVPTPVPTTTPGTPTPTPTSAAAAGGAATTPTPTPTKKPATSAAAATSGAQPVAGVALPTVGLLVGGMLVIMLGVLLLTL